MAELDAKDELILEALKQDARIPFVELAKRVGLSEAAVRRRVQRLTASGIIKRFTIEVEGRGASALTLLSVHPTTPTSQVSSLLLRIKGVEAVYEITGEYDIAALIRAPNIGEINRCIDEIRKIEGVINTNTVIILRTVR